MTKHRPYNHDRIYRIIGGLHCERLGEGGFVCGSRAMLETRAQARQTEEPKS